MEASGTLIRRKPHKAMPSKFTSAAILRTYTTINADFRTRAGTGKKNAKCRTNNAVGALTERPHTATDNAVGAHTERPHTAATDSEG